jgi:hypothetical protein
MSPTDLRKIIKETVQDILSERYDYDHLTDDVPSSSEIGKAWSTAVYSLATLMNEIDGFNDSFATALQKAGVQQKIAEQTYLAQLKQIMQALEQLHAPVKLMAKIQQMDGLYQEDHSHGRYAQQAGATPFQPPQDSSAV